MIDGKPQPPENLGPEINTTDNDCDPMLGMSGFRLYFSSDRKGGRGGYDLYSSDSREVYARTEMRPLPKVSLSALALLGAILLGGPLAMLLRTREARDLLQRCLLFSLLMHLLLVMGFSAVSVSRDIIQYVRQETGMEIPLSFEASRSAEVQLAVRNQLMDLPTPAAPAPVKGESAWNMQVDIDAASPRAFDINAPAPPPGAMAIHVPAAQLPVPPAIESVALQPPQLAIDIPNLNLAKNDPISARDDRITVDAPRPAGVRAEHPHIGGSAGMVVASADPTQPLTTPLPIQPLAPPKLMTPAPLVVALPAIRDAFIIPDVDAPHLSPSTIAAAIEDVASPAPLIGPKHVAAAMQLDHPTTFAQVAPIVSRAGEPMKIDAPPTRPVAPPLASAIDIAPPTIDIAMGTTRILAGEPLVEKTQDRLDPPRPADPTRARIIRPLGSESLAPDSITLPLDSVHRRTDSLPLSTRQSPPPPGLYDSPHFDPQASLSPLDSLGPKVLPEPQVLSQRQPEQREILVKSLGGSKETEQAAAQALSYLARNQQPDGRWTKYTSSKSPRTKRIGEHDSALTGLAALAFLASDQTPDKGEHAAVVNRALEYLLQAQQFNGNLRGDDGNMYDQAIGTIAIAEAAILTGEQRYRTAAQRASDFIVSCQNRESGGWRYTPYDFGDMSVSGWQIMALHSAQEAGRASTRSSSAAAPIGSTP